MISFMGRSYDHDVPFWHIH